MYVTFLYCFLFLCLLMTCVTQLSEVPLTEDTTDTFSLLSFFSLPLSSSHFFSSLSLSPLTLSLFSSFSLSIYLSLFLSLSLSSHSLSFLLSLFLLSHTLFHALSLLSLVCNLSFPSPSLLQIPLTSAFYSTTIDFQIYGIKELKKCGLRRTNQEVYLPSTLK